MAVLRSCTPPLVLRNGAAHVIREEKAFVQVQQLVGTGPRELGCLVKWSAGRRGQHGRGGGVLQVLGLHRDLRLGPGPTPLLVGDARLKSHKKHLISGPSRGGWSTEEELMQNINF